MSSFNIKTIVHVLQFWLQVHKLKYNMISLSPVNFPLAAIVSSNQNLSFNASIGWSMVRKSGGRCHPSSKLGATGGLAMGNAWGPKPTRKFRRLVFSFSRTKWREFGVHPCFKKNTKVLRGGCDSGILHGVDIWKISAETDFSWCRVLTINRITGKS